MIKRSRGFAMIGAIMIIGLIGAALFAMVIAFFMEARRTWRQNEDAQLRQLLLAGAQLAVQWAPTSRPTESQVITALPDSLKDQDTELKLSFQPTAANPNNEVNVLIEASLPEVHSKERDILSQTLHLSRQNNTWQITSAIIER